MTKKPTDELEEKLLSERAKAVPTSRLSRALGLSRMALGTGARMLGYSGNATDLTRHLGQMKGLAMKAGQILSYMDIGLPEEYRATLAALQTTAPTAPFEDVKRRVEAELEKPLSALYARFDEKPIACASIGQVHRAQLPSGEEVVVKVLHEGVEEALRADFKNATSFAAIANLMAPHTKPQDIVAELQDRFLAECDYRTEAAWQIRFGELFAGDAQLVVPRVFLSHCTKGVLTTEFQKGVVMREFLAQNPTSEQRNKCGEALYRFYVCSLYQYGVINCDPHPGNYIFRPDGKIVVLDYGCMREFSPEYVEKLRALARAAMQKDNQAILRSAEALDILPADTRNIDEAAMLDVLLISYQPILEPGPYRFDRDLTRNYFKKLSASKRNLMKMRLPAELVFLNRITLGLFAVLAELEAAFDARKLVDRGLTHDDGDRMSIASG